MLSSKIMATSAERASQFIMRYADPRLHLDSTSPGRRLKVLLLGTGIRNSISPAIHNQLFKEFGLNAEYLLFDICEDEWESAMSALVNDNDLLGFNVTAPFKERILPYITKLDEVASSVAAVNTVRVRGSGTNDSVLEGYNTDVEGVIASLERLGIQRFQDEKISSEIGSVEARDEGGQQRTEKKAAILGAGGAARACVRALIDCGFNSIEIMNRSKSRSEAIALHFTSRYPAVNFKVSYLEGGPIRKAISSSRVVINAISERAALDGLALNFEQLAEHDFAFLDLGYKGESLLLRQARRAGVNSLDGLVMLAAQARKSFEIWSGILPQLSLVEAIATQAIQEARSV